MTDDWCCQTPVSRLQPVLHHLSEEQISFSKLFGFTSNSRGTFLIDKAAVYPLELSLPTYCISLSLLFSRVPSILSNILFNPSHHSLFKQITAVLLLCTSLCWESGGRLLTERCWGQWTGGSLEVLSLSLSLLSTIYCNVVIFENWRVKKIKALVPAQYTHILVCRLSNTGAGGTNLISSSPICSTH